MGKVQNNLKECALAFVMLIICVAGIIAGIGAVNYGFKNEEIFFIVVGDLNIPCAIMGTYAFYKAYLKPTES